MKGYTVLCLAAVLSFALCYPIARALRHLGVIDRPNQRSSHQVPTVRGGGIAIILVVLFGGLAAGWRSDVALVLMGLSFGLAAVSLWDDLQPLPPTVRFGGHALAALGVLHALDWPRFSLEVASQPGVAWPAPMSGLLLFLWLTGYTNAFNFMDGINGLAAGQAIVTGLGMALLGSVASGQWSVVSPPVLLSLVVAGAALGFLPHNFPNARMFMGDVGSAPLGFLLAALVIWMARGFGWWLLVPLALLHANFVLDTGITLVRRVLRGERWYDAHREHFYQRLIRAGKSHPFVTGLEMALQG
ncbi:MAG: glycosyltransferase family 4 protein, partial [Verrucomicrobia bacterium]|nr:glycosyltransferase family 4 protein [Verrucomicrobiota bacterium]